MKNDELDAVNTLKLQNTAAGNARDTLMSDTGIEAAAWSAEAAAYVLMSEKIIELLKAA